MAERLEYIKLDPQRALDAGCGDKADLAQLSRRFPKAEWHALDFAFSRLAEHHGLQGARRGPFRQAQDRLFERLGSSVIKAVDKMRGGRSPQLHPICADFGALPFAPRSLDFIWSNLALHWHEAPHRVFPEWARALNVGGLVLFSAFGPDTLKEVSLAFSEADPNHASPVIAFTDMHDYGDMLVEAGFATPVVDAERLTLTYADRAALWRDVRALGGNPLAARRRGSIGRAAFARLNDALDAQRTADGRYPLSFEIIYGHAWKGQPKTASDGRAIIRLDWARKPPQA